MNSQTSKRDSSLDIARGIAILLVILGHCGGIPDMPYRHFIYTFHIPLFFIISGLLYKPKPISTALKNDAKHLLIPYFATGVVVFILSLVKGFIKGDITNALYHLSAIFWGAGTEHLGIILSDVPSIGAIWFLPALFFCRNIYNCLSSIDIKKKLLISTIIFLVATLLGRYVIFIPFSFLQGLSAIIFYAIGDYLKSIKTNKGYLWLIGFVCWGLSFKFSEIDLNRSIINLYYIDVIGATTMSIVIIKLSKALSKINIVSDLFSWIGRFSLIILCFHTIDHGISKQITQELFSSPNGLMFVLSRVSFPIVLTVLYSCISKKAKGIFKNFNRKSKDLGICKDEME